MRLFQLMVLVSAHPITFVLAIQIDHSLTQPTGLVSSISNLMYRHTGYVDQKVRQDPYTLLNHESWHQRKVIAIASNVSLGPSNITSDAIVEDESFILPAADPSNSSSNDLSPAGDHRLTDIPELAHAIQTLSTSGEPDATWGDQTNAACIAALETLRGVASNPAGLAICYNIRSYDNVSRSLEADLRLYRITAPIGNWTQLDNSSESLDITYTGARITTHASKWKRESTRLDLPPVQEREAKDLYRRRSNGAPPALLEGLMYTVAMDDEFSAESIDGIAADSPLYPDVFFSGSTVGGIPLSTRLSTDEASFVNGLFMNYGTLNKTAIGRGSGLDDDLMIPGNTLVVFPVGLVITSVWALLLMMIMGYGTMSRYQARESYKKRVMARMSGGTIRVRQI